MPVYEYQCESCGRKFDLVATLAEKEAGLRPVCPGCGATRTRQVFSRFTLLTGSKTDDLDTGDDDMGDSAGSDFGGMDDDYGSDGSDSLEGADDMDDL